MAKRRAAFLLKQQRKAEESRLRKQQQEAESELKRDEARFVFIPHTHKSIAGTRGLSKSAGVEINSACLNCPSIFPQGVRQKRIVSVRRRRRRGESLLSRNTCGGSSKR